MCLAENDNPIYGQKQAVRIESKMISHGSARADPCESACCRVVPSEGMHEVHKVQHKCIRDITLPAPQGVHRQHLFMHPKSARPCIMESSGVIFQFQFSIKMLHIRGVRD
jgi:hypothetical protein